MNCPWLKGKGVKQCGAVNCPVVVSIVELDNYCNGGSYPLCPVFQARKKQRKDLNVDQYFVQFTKGLVAPAIAKQA